MTLHALWQKCDDLFTVYYDLNDGVMGTENPVSVGAGEVHKLNAASKTGYTFLGWNTREDGKGEYIEYLYGVDETLCLYAIFEPKEYLIRYEYEGMYESGKVNPNYIAYGNAVTLYPVYRTGYKFIGWFDSEEGGEQVTVVDESNILGLTWLYAHFEVLEYEITLDAGEGVFATPEGESSFYLFVLRYDETFDLPACTMGGYVFLGWTDENGEKSPG